MISSWKQQIHKYDLNDLKGQFLIGSPNIYENDIFTQSIILIIEQNAQETKGLIINQVLKNSSINDVLKMMSEYHAKDDYNFNLNLFLGGPIDYNKIYILHSNDYHSTHTQKINEKIYMTSNIKIIEDIKNNLGPQNFLCVMGHTNWYKDQLQEEINTNQWIVQDSSENILFFERNKLKWYMSLQKLGINPDKSYIFSINN